MYKPLPATVANEIHERLTAAICRAETYLSSTGIEFTKFLDELNTLGKVDGSARSTLLVLLHTLCGNRDEAEYYLANSRKLGESEFDVALFEMTMLMNLGYFSQALLLMAKFEKPQDGIPTLLIDKAPCNGAFHTVISMSDQAHHMKIANLPELPTVVREAAAIMDQWGDTDADFSAALDVAGAIMRERHLFYQGDIVTVPVQLPADGSPPYVRLTFKVAVDLDTSIEMTCNYAERLALSGLKIPPSMIFEFEGTRQ